MSRPYAFWYLVLAVIALIAGLVPIMLSNVVSIWPFVTTIVMAIVVPPPLIWIMQKLGYPIGKPLACPRCGTEIPLFRKPANTSQALWGGNTCQGCGAVLDRKGRVVG
jgi:hypothetical protein